MDCKRDCNWNYDGICCSDELDYRYDEATGDDNCPLWLRPNFDEYFHDTLDYIRESIKRMNISKLEQVKYAIDQINIECETKERLERGGYSFGSCNICKTKECKYNPNISIAEKFNRLIGDNKNIHKISDWRCD